MVPNSYVITGLILPGNYATLGQKGIKNKQTNKQKFKYSMCHLEKNNLNQQNRQYIYTNEGSKKDISHSFISGFRNWLQY